jgi:hypothetical protein
LLSTVTTAGGSLVYTDEDGDGFSETATVTVAGITATTEACKVKVYFTGKDGEMEWEIRPARKKTLVGGVFMATFDSWLFIDPDLQSVYPDENGFSAVDISTIANYVTSAEVYYERADTTLVSAQFAWEPSVTSTFCSCCNGTGCEACAETTQNGCATIRDARTGILTPTPATYDTSWTIDGFSGACRAPDQVRLWYFAGEQSKEFLSGRSCDPLSSQWAKIIAELATARLEKPPCGCAFVRQRFEYFQEDLTKSISGQSFFSGNDATDSPFGPTRGAVLAWKAVKHLVGRRMAGVAV